jgi:hypothetical protein
MGDPTTDPMRVFDWSPGALIWINSRSREGGIPVVDEGPPPVAWVRLQWAISNRATYLRALDSLIH